MKGFIRFPFYYPVKTLFLLYLSLPQTRGSTYLYRQHLQPFFNTYESDIDAALASLKTRVYVFVQDRARMLWEYIAASIGQHADASGAGDGSAATGPPVAGGGSAAPPSLNDPVSGPAQLLGGLWRSYGPTIIASGAALLRQSAPPASGATSAFFNPAAPAAHTPLATPSDFSRPSAPRADTTRSVLERRRQLEAELAALAAQDAQPIPVQHGSSAYLPISPTGSDADLRTRGGQFEEVEVPSDVEGYDMRPTRPGDGMEQGQGGASGGVQMPVPNRRTSWFGWGAAAGASPGGSIGKGGYERVKDE